MKLKRVNLFFGIFLFIIFLLTGFYMQEYFKPNHINQHLMRLQIRSNHIYILFISLLNIVAFKCYLQKESRWLRFTNFCFRSFLITAGVLSFFAFIYEHTGNIDNRLLTLITIVLSLVAILFYLINMTLSSSNKK